VVLPIRDDNPTKRTAVVTIALIAINLFVYFVVQPHTGSDAEQTFLYEHAAIPCEITTGHPITAVPPFSSVSSAGDTCVVGANVETPRRLFPRKLVLLGVIESLFLHGSVVHVLGNMLFLWIFGNNVEDRMGPILYTIFYFAAGIVATTGFILFNLHATTPLVGASGAIAGVMGAYFVWFPRARVLTLIVFFPVYLPAMVVLGFWFLLQFVTNPNEGVAWQAHVAGFLFGVLVAWLARPFFGHREAQLRTPTDDWDGGFRGGYPGRQ
jgi:membrane associated rhomboid family serine protease